MFFIKFLLLASLALALILGCLCRTVLSFREIRRLDTLENEIRSLARLTTARQTYREVIYSERTGLITGMKVLFSADFTVDAGVDMEKCRIVRNRREGLLIYLPPVEIFSVDCDETSIEQYFARERLMKVRFSDFGGLLAAEKEVLLREARRSDLIPRAEENARHVVTGTMGSAGGEGVTVRFTRLSGGAAGVIIPPGDQNG